MDKESEKICPACGTTLKQWQESHQLGCHRCFETFQWEIKMYFQRKGYVIGYTEKTDDHFSVALQEALAREDYEEAARLRDIMKGMTGE